MCPFSFRGHLAGAVGFVVDGRRGREHALHPQDPGLHARSRHRELSPRSPPLNDDKTNKKLKKQERSAGRHNRTDEEIRYIGLTRSSRDADEKLLIYAPGTRPHRRVPLHRGDTTPDELRQVRAAGLARAAEEASARPHRKDVTTTPCGRRSARPRMDDRSSTSRPGSSTASRRSGSSKAGSPTHRAADADERDQGIVPERRGVGRHHELRLRSLHRRANST
jgi:hypothetical protein